MVFEGCSKLLANDVELACDVNKSEAAVRAWAEQHVNGDSTLDQVLLAKTLLYAVAGKTSAPVDLANAVPSVEEGGEADETAADAGAKKKKKQRL